MKRNPRQKNDNVAYKPGPGRPKGSKDKFQQDIKKAVLEVWAKLEKDKLSLYNEAKLKPAWFYENFVKPMIPKNVEMKSETELVINIISAIPEPKPRPKKT